MSVLFVGCYYNNSKLQYNTLESNIYREVIAHNNSLQSFKASGTLSLKNDTIKQTAKIICAGDRYGNFRFDILTITGMPVGTLASNGESFFFISYYPYNYIKKKHSKNILKHIVDIDLSIKEALLLLHGGIPIKNKIVILNKNDAKKNIENTANTINQIIFINDDGISSLKLMSKNNDCIVSFKQTRKLDELNIPDTIEIINNTGTHIKVILRSREINVNFNKEIFSPKPQKQ